MLKAKKFADVIERIEYLRNLLNLNKSRFSAEIGMKPQTYNNFIGAQGSKPNVELIFGIVNQFGVNPMWLLNGVGPIFQDESKGAEYMGVPLPSAATAKVGEADAAYGLGTSAKTLEALRDELRALEPALGKMEQHVRQLEADKLPLVERYIAILRRYYEVDPVNAISEFRELLARIERHLFSKE